MLITAGRDQGWLPEAYYDLLMQLANPRVVSHYDQAASAKRVIL